MGRSLPEYQRVRDYVVRAEPLPRTATRKIKRFELQKEIAENGYDSKASPDKKPRTFTAEDEAMLNSNIGKALIKAIKQNTENDERIHPEMSLEIDLGLDSLSRAEVFAALEQNFNIEFDSDKAANALTVGEVIKLTQEYTGSVDAEIVNTDFDWGDIVRHAGANGNIPEIQAILDKSAFSTLVVNVFFKFAYSVFKLLLSLEVSGNEELKNIKRPYLICPNHQSFLDPFVVVSTFDSDTLKHSFAVGATDFFNSPFMLSIARLLNTIPIDPDAQLMKAMKAGAVGLKHGKILNIFPEGERGFDGNLSTFKKGAAILATELEMPIVPVALDGLYKVWGRKSNKINLSKVKVRFGNPFYPKDVISENMENEAKYEAVTAHLKNTIAMMLEEMRKNDDSLTKR